MVHKKTEEGQIRDDAISLAPLTPEEALRALLKVDPDDEPANEDDGDIEAEQPVR